MAVAWATMASAQISLEMNAVTPGSPDVVVTWVSAGSGPFHLLSFSRASGTHLADVLPLDPVTQRVRTDITSPLVLAGAADPTRPAGVTLYQVVDDAGGCSNVGCVVRIAPPFPGNECDGWTYVAPPWRGLVRDARAMLRQVPTANEVSVLDPACCREVRLWRTSTGFGGRNARLEPGRGALIHVTTSTNVVLVGAAEPGPHPLALADHLSCTPGRQLLAFGVATPEVDARDFLCGIGWPDADSDSLPDACTAGFHGGRAERTIIALPPNSERGPSGEDLRATVVLGTTRISGNSFPSLLGTPISLDNSLHAMPDLTFLPRDLGASSSCRCPDTDGDGDDDCTENLRGTDPADAASRGLDTDGDGVIDSLDTCPTDPDPGNPDADGDHRGDACDPCPHDAADACSDDDGDGVENGVDDCEAVADPGQADTDGDGVGDACDPEPWSAGSCLSHRLIPGDVDGDGVTDNLDNCVSTPNPDQVNADSDAWGDSCDPCPLVADTGLDWDGDGFPNACDTCDTIPSADQTDRDGDGVGDICDNCPDASNPGQENHDRDPLGDACDNCPTRDNADQRDGDADGTADACDNCPAVPNADQLDAEPRDGVGEACTVMPEDCCPPVVLARAGWPGCLDSGGLGTWVGADSMGGVYLAWGSSLCGQLVVSRDDGAAWEAPLDVFRPGIAALVGVPRFAGSVDASGRLTLAWVEGTSVMARSSLDQGRTFLPPVELGACHGQPSQELVGMVSDDAGVVVVAWESYQANGPVDVAVSVDAGASWRPPLRIFEPGPLRVLQVPSIVITSNEILVAHVATDGPAASPRYLAVRRSVDRGASWAPAVSAGNASSLLALLTTSGGHVQALSLLGNELRLSVSSDGGATWPAQGELLTSTSSARERAATASPDGLVVVSWRDSAAGVTPLVQSSRSHGLPGTWLPAPDVASPESDNIDEIALVIPEPGEPWAIHSDYRIGVPNETAWATRSCDGGATWPAFESRVDDYTRPDPPHAEISAPPSVGRNGRVHVVWSSGVLTSILVGYAALEVRPRATVQVEDLPNVGCRPPLHLLSVAPDFLSRCLSPSFNWQDGGVPIAGATDATYTVPEDATPGTHLYSCIVRCEGALTCGGTTSPVSVDVADPTTPVRGADLAGLLRVKKEGSGLRFSWTDGSPSPTSYALYGGTIVALHREARYDHVPMLCDVPRPPSATSISTPLSMTPYDAYYLIAPADCSWEGGVGADSFGRRRPLSPVDPPCGPGSP